MQVKKDIDYYSRTISLLGKRPQHGIVAKNSREKKSMKLRQILVIIPTYNERENILGVLDGIKQLGLSGISILVVDDNSPDGTADIVREYGKHIRGVTVLQRTAKSGLGPAYLDGFRYARGNGFDLVIMMDGDLSHDPNSIPDLIAATDHADMAVGSRYLKGVNVVNWSLSRLIISWLASVYTRLITGLPLKDCTSGFKCFKSSLLKTIPLDEICATGYSFQIELHFQAWKRGCRLKEVPIVFYERSDGQSKMSKGIIVEAIFKVWGLKLRDLIGRLQSQKSHPVRSLHSGEEA